MTNCVLQYGKNINTIKIGRILYGMEIQGNEDHGQGGPSDGGYASKVFYTRQMFQSTFSIEAIFATWEEREAFATWATTYQKSISNWMNPSAANYMRVRGPRGFDFLGVLTEGIVRSNEVKDLVWTMNLVFRGSQPTKSSTSFVKTSVFSPPNPHSADYDVQSIYYYPADMDINAKIGTKEDSIYKTPTPTRITTPGAKNNIVGGNNGLGFTPPVLTTPLPPGVA